MDQGKFIKGELAGAALTVNKCQTYFGQNRAEKRHGIGVEKKDGVTYSGQWSDGDKHGLGC